jgi:hypothetical protein
MIQIFLCSCRKVKGKDLWCSRITIGFDSNQKQIRKAFYGKTKKRSPTKSYSGADKSNARASGCKQ